MKPIDYEQHLRFMHLYNAALAAQEQETLARSLRRMSRHNSYTSLPFDRSHPPPVRRADSSGKLERRKSLTRTSSESGYNSNLEHRHQSRSLDRGLTKRSSTVSDSGTYEGYPRVRRVSVVKDLEYRPPTPPIIKRKGSSTRSNDSMSPSVRFSTVEDIMSAYGHGDSWSGRYKPRKSIDRESHISAHSMDHFDERHGRRSSSASRGYDEFDGGRRSSSIHRRESSSSRRASVSSRRASVSSRRSSVASVSRRPSTSSRASYYDGHRMSIINPNGIEGAEIMRRLSRASELKEWERSSIMSRRSSKSSSRGSRRSRRRSTSSRRRSSVGYSSSSASDSSSDSDSDSYSDSSSSGSGTSDSDSDSSSGSSSGSDTESDSDNEDGRERKSSKSTNIPSTHGGNDGNAGFDRVDGGRTSRANGGMAFSTDGDSDWRANESHASSSVCVIL